MSRKKRTAGEGSIFQDSRGYWNVQIPNGFKHGRMRYKRIRSKTLAGLHEKKRSFERDRARGLLVDDRSPRLAAFLQDWLEKAVITRNRYRTWQSYRYIVETYLIPHLGNYKVEDVRRSHVQAMITDLIASGLAPRTIRNIRSCLRRALTVAERDGYVTQNVAKYVDMPKPKKYTITTLSPAQARHFLQAVEGHRLQALFWTALLLGLREGELCGLRLEDVSLTQRTLTPTYTVQRQRGTLVLADLKTEFSHAPLMLPACLVPILRDHLARLGEERRCTTWHEHGLLFPSSRGTILEPRNLARQFKTILKTAQLPEIRFHDLRHTCGTLLAERGEHISVIQSVLRHASPQTTMEYYTHSRNEVQHAALDGLGSMLTEPE